MFPFVLFFSVCIYTIKDGAKKETLQRKENYFFISEFNLFCSASFSISESEAVVEACFK
jgi:hypothetical protein